MPKSNLGKMTMEVERLHKIAVSASYVLKQHRDSYEHRRRLAPYPDSLGFQADLETLNRLQAVSDAAWADYVRAIDAALHAWQERHGE